MSSIRTLKPEYWASESLAKLPRDVRSTFQVLWTEADCAGRGKAASKVLASHIWPWDDELSADVIEEFLQILEASDHIVLYVVEGTRYYAVTNWKKHQSSSYTQGTSRIPP